MLAQGENVRYVQYRNVRFNGGNDIMRADRDNDHDDPTLTVAYAHYIIAQQVLLIFSILEQGFERLVRI